MINSTTAGNAPHNMQKRVWSSRDNAHQMNITHCTGCGYQTGISYNKWYLCSCPQLFFGQRIIESSSNYVKVQVYCQKCKAYQEDYLY